MPTSGQTPRRGPLSIRPGAAHQCIYIKGLYTQHPNFQKKGDVANELWIARESLAKVGKPGYDIGANAPIKTWSSYCDEIGEITLGAYYNDRNL